MSNLRRIAYIAITPELIIEALHLPPGTCIVGVKGACPEMEPPTEVVLFVEHHDLPERTDGQIHVGLIPQATVRFAQTRIESRYELPEVPK